MAKIFRKRMYRRDTFKVSFLIFASKFCDYKSNTCLLNYEREQKYTELREAGGEAKFLMHSKRNWEEMCQNGNGSFL